MMTNESMRRAPFRMRNGNNTIWIYAIFEKNSRIKSNAGVGADAERSSQFSNSIFSTFRALCSAFRRLGARGNDGNEQNNFSSHAAHSGARVRPCADLLVYFVRLLCAAQTIDSVRTALFALLLFHRRHTRCITVLCSLAAQYFFLI